MPPVLGLAQAELRPAAHDLAAVVEEYQHHVLERQLLRAAVDDGEVYDAEGRLQLRARIELAQHEVRVRVALQLDDYAHAVSVRFIAQVRNSVDDAGLRALRNRLYEVGLVDHVGYFGDEYRALALLRLLYLDAAADDYLSAPRAVGVDYAVAPEDYAAGREVRPGHQRHQLAELDLRVVEHRAADVDGLAEVVRRHVSRHTDGDAGAAVDEKVRDARRQDERLLERLVEVRPPVYRVLVDVGEHLLAERVEPRLRVTHGRRRVSVDRAEVSLAVDERVAHAEILREARHRVVNSRVAVRVVLTHRLADNTRRLLERLVVAHAELHHSVEYAALHGLQTVARVGQRAAHDDAHRVVEIALLDFFFERQSYDFVYFE